MQDMNTRIRQRRTQLGLSQTDVGKAVGISRAAVAQWEKATDPVTPDPSKWEALARRLKVSKHWLAFGDEKIETGAGTRVQRQVALVGWDQAEMYAARGIAALSGLDVSKTKFKVERTIDVLSSCDDLMALTVHGRSMDRIAPHGSNIVVDYTQTHLKSGSFYLVRETGMPIFRKFNQDRFETFSTETACSVRAKTLAPGRDVKIIGRVAQIVTDLNGG